MFSFRRTIRTILYTWPILGSAVFLSAAEPLPTALAQPVKSEAKPEAAGIFTEGAELKIPDRFFKTTDPVFSPDGKKLVLGGHDYGQDLILRNVEALVLVYDLASRKLQARWSLGKKRRVDSLQFSVDGKLLGIDTSAVGDSFYGHPKKSYLEVWDTAKQRMLKRLPFAKFNNKREVYRMAWYLDQRFNWSFAPDGKAVAVSDWGRAVRFYALEDFQENGKLEVPDARGVFYSPDSSSLALVRNNQVEIWDIKKQTKKAVLGPLAEPETRTGSAWLRFAPDGKTMISGFHSPMQPLKVAPPLLLQNPVPPDEVQPQFGPESASFPVVKAWDLATQKSSDFLPNKVRPYNVPVVFCPSWQTFFTVKPSLLTAPAGLGGGARPGLGGGAGLGLGAGPIFAKFPDAFAAWDMNTKNLQEEKGLKGNLVGITISTNGRALAAVIEPAMVLGGIGIGVGGRGGNMARPGGGFITPPVVIKLFERKAPSSGTPANSPEAIPINKK